MALNPELALPHLKAVRLLPAGKENQRLAGSEQEQENFRQLVGTGWNVRPGSSQRTNEEE
jgi:hypothetical protein